MTTLADLRAILTSIDMQSDTDKRLRAIYRRGVEDGVRAGIDCAAGCCRQDEGCYVADFACLIKNDEAKQYVKDVMERMT
jgi:hypothetical protein